jgi:hypothetical protein
MSTVSIRPSALPAIGRVVTRLWLAPSTPSVQRRAFRQESNPRSTRLPGRTHRVLPVASVGADCCSGGTRTGCRLRWRLRARPDSTVRRGSESGAEEGSRSNRSERKSTGTHETADTSERQGSVESVAAPVCVGHADDGTQLQAAEHVSYAGVHLAGGHARKLLKDRVLSTRTRSLHGIILNASTRATTALGLPGPQIRACGKRLLLEGLAGVWAPLGVALWKSDHSKHPGWLTVRRCVVGAGALRRQSAT